ncbi:hypothetical protein ACE4RV_15850 [Acetobacter persici]|uniref:hypothetical protein n=1 Tax=Acetobacter persici TaxID=1076596 RepID=UPI0036D9B25C
MKKILLICKNHLIISLNKILYSGQNNKKNKKVLALTLSVIFPISILFLAIISFLYLIFMNKIIDTLKLLSPEELNQWISAFCLILILSLLSSNFQRYILRILYSQDIHILFSSPINLKEFFIAKLMERHSLNLLKNILIYTPLLIITFWLCKTNLISSLLITLLIIACTLFTLIFKFFITTKMIHLKLLSKKLIGYTILKTIVFLLNGIYICYLIKPFIVLLPKNNFINIIENINNFKLVNSLHMLLQSKFSINYWMGLAITNSYNQKYNLIVILIITILITCLIIYKIFNKSINKINIIEITDLFSQYHQLKTKDKTTMKKGNEEKLNKVIKLIPNKIKAIIIKDYKLLKRDNKFTWIFIILAIASAYLIVLFTLYFAENKVGTLTFNTSYIGFIITMYGTSIVTYNLMDKFGLDVEGENYIILQNSPTLPKDILLAKIIATIITIIPFNIIMNIISFLIFNTNPLLLIFGSILSIITFAIMSINASITFPNFKYETILDLPSTKAKIQTNFLNSMYILLTICGIYYLNSSPVFYLIFLILNASISFILFKASCKKIENTNIKNYESINSLFE